MARPEKIYRRLPGKGTNLVQYIRLYQGPDHLLQVSSTGFNETYKRFYFRDIQAVVLRQSGWWMFWTILWGALTGLFTLPVVIFGLEAIAAGVFAVIFLVALLIHLLLGPTCAVFVRTAVQTEKLPTLKRLRAARKFLARLRPLVTAVQGQLSPAELAMQFNAPPVIEPHAPGPSYLR